MAAINFVVLLLAVTVFGAYIVAYAAHVFVTVAQQTAGGLDEVAWPKDPWYDWVGKALHLVWLVVFWVVPLGFVLRVIGPQSLAASATLYVGAPAALFWLLFPLTLLSSFSAGSPWVLLRPEVLARMARCPAGTFGFYALSAPLCVAGGAALYATLAHGVFYALPALATVLFLYARLVGRYTRLLGRVRIKAAVPKAGRPEPKKERPRRKKKKKTAQVHDPWAVPEEEPEAGAAKLPVEGYGLAEDEPKPQRREAKKAPRVKGYDVSPEMPPARPKEVPLDGTPPVELTRTAPEGETPLPAHPLMSGVFTFPWYPSNLGVWGLLTLLFLGWALLYTTMQAVRPF
jgi:hypothetical protein